jgi:hypothetical protein
MSSLDRVFRCRQVLTRGNEANRERAPYHTAHTRSWRERAPRIQTLRRPFLSRIVVSVAVETAVSAVKAESSAEFMWQFFLTR